MCKAKSFLCSSVGRGGGVASGAATQSTGSKTNIVNEKVDFLRSTYFKY
jgi:hypothetical protein